MKRALSAALGLLIGGMATLMASQPPTPQEMEELRSLPADELRARMQRTTEHASSLPLTNLLRSRVGLPPILQSAGPSAIVPGFLGNPIPRTGDVDVLLVLCEFQDHRLECTDAQYREHYFGQGDASRVPHDSVRNYYLRSSGDQLRMNGDVFRVRLPHNRDHYRPQKDPAKQDELDRQAYENLLQLVLSSYHEKQGDPTRFDYNGDGKMDFVHIVYAGPRDGWGSFFWAYCRFAAQLKWNSQRGSIEYSGRYIIENEQIRDGKPDPSTAIHEYGHALGLPDLYDFDDSDPDPNRVRSGPDGGVGDLDMMDANQHELNGVFRWALGWSDPLFIVDHRHQVVRLAPRSSSPGASDEAGVVLIPEYVSEAEDPQAAGFPAPIKNGPASTNNVQPYEFYFLEYRVREGNDCHLPGEGVLIWHVQLTDPAHQGKRNDNHSTVRKLIHLVEADNGNDIVLQRAEASASDFFQSGQQFGGKPTANLPPGAVPAPGYPLASGLMPGPDVYAQIIGIDPRFALVRVGNTNGPLLASLFSRPKGIEEELWENESREVELRLESRRGSNETVRIQTDPDFGMSVAGGNFFQLKAGQALQKTLVFSDPQPNWFGRKDGFLFVGGGAPLKQILISILRLDAGDLSLVGPARMTVRFPESETVDFTLERTHIEEEIRPLPFTIETAPFIQVVQAPQELAEGMNNLQFAVSSAAIPREDFPDNLGYQNPVFTLDTEITVTDQTQQKVSRTLRVDVTGSRPKSPLNPTAEWWVPPATSPPAVRQALVSFRLEWEQPSITNVEKTELAVFSTDASARIQAGQLLLGNAREGTDYTKGVIANGGQLSGLLIAGPYPNYRDQLWAVRAVNPWGPSDWSDPASFPDEAPPQVAAAPKLDLRDKPMVLDPDVLERLGSDLKISPQELEKLKDAVRPIPNPNGEPGQFRQPDLKRPTPLQKPIEPLKPLPPGNNEIR